MSREYLQRRHWKLSAHGQQIHLVNGGREREVHILMKAFLWALYLPQYPDLQIERRVDDRYKPDVVSMDEAAGKPRFWAEAGRVSPDKVAALVKRYRYTHFVIAKWSPNITVPARMVADALQGVKRDAPFDVIGFADDHIEQFLDSDGNLSPRFEAVNWRRFSPDDSP